ncbi:hypothetical protein DL770_007786 [Monosporascus sp. CRB-9-2]|nr:hypothetical protein DL770_007786 [Monosporascus sp. CRB-9-2]
MHSATGNSPTARPASNTGSDSTSASEPPFEPMPDAHQTTGDYTGGRELALWGPLVVNGLVRVASDVSVGGIVHARRSWALTGSLEIKPGSQLTTESDVSTGSLCVRGPFKPRVGGDESTDEVSVMGQLIVCKDAKIALGKVIVLGDVILEDMTFLYALSNDRTAWK